MTERKDCMEARQSFDGQDGFAPEQLLKLETHLRGCSDCCFWRKQTNALRAAAIEMPLYDVPESLTQKIISSVQVDSDRERVFVRTGLLVLTTLGALYALVAVDSFENLNGLFAWIIGAVALFGLKILIGSNGHGNDIVQT